MCVFGCVEPERKLSQKRAISPAETSEETLPFQLILYNPVQKDNFSHVTLRGNYARPGVFEEQCPTEHDSSFATQAHF